MPTINRLLLALFVFLVFGLATAAPAYAGAVQLLARTDLNPTDLTFVFPEAANTTQPQPYIRPAGGGNTITIFSPGALGNAFTRFDRNDGTHMLFNGANPFVPTSNIVDISFANGVTEIGLNARPNTIAGGTFTFEAFNGATSLGIFSVVADSGNFFVVAGPFIGVRATGGDVITRLRITLGGGDTNGFEIDPVTFGNGSVNVPEPATMLLLGTGLAGIAAKVRRRRQAK